jgi:hypothetical protein
LQRWFDFFVPGQHMDFQYFGIMKAATRNEKCSFASLLISVAQLRRMES